MRKKIEFFLEFGKNSEMTVRYKFNVCIPPEVSREEPQSGWWVSGWRGGMASGDDAA